MYTKLATILIFFIIFLFTTTSSSCKNTKIIKSKDIKKIDSRYKFQFLNVNNFEIILKFLNLEDFPHFFCACEKSKSNYLRQTILKLFQTFHKNQIEKSSEYLTSELFHAKQHFAAKKKHIQIFEKYLNIKTISLPKFVDHIIQTPTFRIISHVDGFFTIEEKLKNQKQYSNMNIENCFSENFSTDEKFRKNLNCVFSSKHFLTSILNHHNNIYLIFEEGEILICGKTGKTRICFHGEKLHTVSHFISENKTYLTSYCGTQNSFVVYHIPSGEIFSFINSFLSKSFFLNPLHYDFFKSNANSCGFVNSNDFLFKQMMAHVCEVQISAALNLNLVNEMLEEIINN